MASPLLHLSIEATDAGPAWTGHTASLLCHFRTSADDFRLQYITWTKITLDVVTLRELRREFVYEYDSCSSADQAYGSLIGRARIVVFNESTNATNPEVNAVLPLPVIPGYFSLVFGYILIFVIEIVDE